MGIITILALLFAASLAGNVWLARRVLNVRGADPRCGPRPVVRSLALVLDSLEVPRPHPPEHQNRRSLAEPF